MLTTVEGVSAHLNPATSMRTHTGAGGAASVSQLGTTRGGHAGSSANCPLKGVAILSLLQWSLWHGGPWAWWEAFLSGGTPSRLIKPQQSPSPAQGHPKLPSRSWSSCQSGQCDPESVSCEAGLGTAQHRGDKEPGSAPHLLGVLEKVATSSELQFPHSALGLLAPRSGGLSWQAGRTPAVRLRGQERPCSPGSSPCPRGLGLPALEDRGRLLGAAGFCSWSSRNLEVLARLLPPQSEAGSWMGLT